MVIILGGSTSIRMSSHTVWHLDGRFRRARRASTFFICPTATQAHSVQRDEKACAQLAQCACRRIIGRGERRRAPEQILK